MTKFKKRFIKIGIIALMPILALLLCLQNTYAYYLDNDGNLVSNNLLDITLQNGSQNGISYSVNNGQITLNGRANNYVYIVIGTTALDGTYYISGDRDNVQVFMQIAPQYYHNTSFTYTGTLETRLEISPNVTFSNYVISPMLNEGTTALDFEPFGLWIKSNDYLSVYPFNASNWEFESGQLNGNSLTEFDEVVSFDNSFIDLKLRYLEDYQGYNYNNNSVSVTYVSDRLNTFSSFTAISSMSNNDGYSFVFFKDNENVLSTIVFNEDTSNENMNFTYPIEFNKIIIYIETSKFYDTTYVNNFSVNVGTFYQGYEYAKDLLENDKEQIYTDGYNQGYNQGQTTGYNQGYNEGIEQDLETTGVKTLFNSILSYPVNMIKSVFNFEFMGVNIASVIMFIVSIGIVIFVVKKFKE